MPVKSKNVKVTYTMKHWDRIVMKSFDTVVNYDTKSYKLEDKNKREIMRELLRDPLVLSVRFDDVDTEEQLEGVEQ